MVAAPAEYDDHPIPTSRRMTVSRWLPCVCIAIAGCAMPAGPNAFPPSGAPLAVPVTPGLPVTPTHYPPESPPGTDWGRFQGQLRLELVGGRDARLVNNFSYTDPRGKVWNAPRGSIVNGASIPQFFWSFVGGPWDGAYRQASVVHDVACETMQASWQDTHRMFYEACRCGGVDERTAKLMYWAVHHFGPRWESRTATTSEVRIVDGRSVTVDVPTTTPQRIAASVPTAAQWQQAQRYFLSENPPLDAIPDLRFAAQ